MKKILLLNLILFSQLSSFHLDNNEIFSLKKNGENLKRPDVSVFFDNVQPAFTKEAVVTDPIKLQNAAKLALMYFRKNKQKNPHIVKPEPFNSKVLSGNDVEKTLNFIIWSIENDKKRKRPYRILDTNFLNKNFKFIKWSGDTKSAHANNVKIPENILSNGSLKRGNIRLTKYAIFGADGSYKKTNKYNCPLYKIVSKNFEKKDRFKYTKQDVIKGVLDQKINRGRVKPMVWLTRDGLEDAIMQGSILVNMPNGKKRLFNVDKNNGIAYDKKIKEPKLQKRYWYFKEIDNKSLRQNNILNQGCTVFAGDIYNIGLGKIIALRYQNLVSKKDEIRLGVLNDVGGAFANNLYQLDLFAGVFKNRDSFNDLIKTIPNSVEAYLLVKSS